jgi:hypothetical protein
MEDGASSTPCATSSPVNLEGSEEVPMCVGLGYDAALSYYPTPPMLKQLPPEEKTS